MKCDTCKNKMGYTLGNDECGAGSYFIYCSKGHWEGTDQQGARVLRIEKDPWKNCKDYIIV